MSLSGHVLCMRIHPLHEYSPTACAFTHCMNIHPLPVRTFTHCMCMCWISTACPSIYAFTHPLPPPSPLLPLELQDDMRALKDRMMMGGAARNKMLVKGGSSFNALVRAMKQVRGRGDNSGGRLQLQAHLSRDGRALSRANCTFMLGSRPMHCILFLPPALSCVVLWLLSVH